MAVTPYMSMDLPVVSATLGPAWASKINAALQLNDAHDHSTGKGVPVRPAGLYMDADLDFRGTNPKNMRSVRFQLLSSLIGGVDDVCCLYFKGADLYVNDSAGNQIQITSGGGIIGTPGSISGLVSPAAVTYTPASKIFNFYSDSLVRASVGCGPLTIADPVTSGKGVTISVPSGLTGNYALELPGALPGATKLMAMGSTGQITASHDVDNLTLEISGTTLRVKDLGVTSDVVSIASGFSATSGHNVVHKWGSASLGNQRATLHLWVTRTSGSTSTCGTVPAGYRPDRSIAWAALDSGPSLVRAFMDISGDISLSGITTGVVVYLQITYKV
jgi:hypothetical protein